MSSRPGPPAAPAPMESLCPLFVFKVHLERVLLVDETAMLVGVPLSARVQFLDMPLEAVAAVAGGGATHAKAAVSFEGFPERKTAPFYSDATALLRSLQRQPLAVTLYQQHPAAPLPVVVGAASVPVADAFATLLTRANKCAPRHPLAAVVRDEYAVLDAGKVGVQVGTVALSARLVCFDGQALEQMRADKVRAATASAALGSLTPRRTSHPCADDKMVTPATDTCSKCMLPKRPPSTSRHAHLREPSQATILEENNNSRDLSGRPALAHVPRAPSQQQPSERLSEARGGDHHHPPAVTASRITAQDASGDTTSATAANEKVPRPAPASAASAADKEVPRPAPASAASAADKEVQRPAPEKVAAKDTELAEGRAALASTVCAALPASSASTWESAASAASADAGPRRESAGRVGVAGQHGDDSGTGQRVAGQGVDGEPDQGLAGEVVDGGRGQEFKSQRDDAKRGQELAGTRVDGRDARASGSHREARASRCAPGEPHPSASKDTASAGTARPKGPKAAIAAATKTQAAPGTEADAKVAASQEGQPWAASGARTMCVWEGETHLTASKRSSPATATERQFKLPNFAARDGDRIAANFRRMREAPPRVVDVDLEMNLSAPLRRYGHTDCAAPPKLVPANQGWLWCPESSADHQPRSGWYPGAIPRGLRLRPTQSEGV